MKKILLLIGIIAMMPACQYSQDSRATNTEESDLHKAVVKEVLQTSNYTYLRIEENYKEVWLALPLMQAKVGDTYYYEGEMEMNNFESKELNRTFEKIYFLAGVSTEPIKREKNKVEDIGQSGNENVSVEGSPHSSQTTVMDISKTKIEKAKDGITIAELFSKKEKYSEKKVKIRGLVTKFNPEIMNTNWLHIQDGTEFDGKFDLTVTSHCTVNLGDTVTLEGKITLNKDLGHGYFFDVMMEEAERKQ